MGCCLIFIVSYLGADGTYIIKYRHFALNVTAYGRIVSGFAHDWKV